MFDEGKNCALNRLVLFISHFLILKLYYFLRILNSYSFSNSIIHYTLQSAYSLYYQYELKSLITYSLNPLTLNALARVKILILNKEEIKEKYSYERRENEATQSRTL